MTKKLTSGTPTFSGLVERQMRNWEIARSQKRERWGEAAEPARDFLCISQMVGVDDRGVAYLVGQRLGWPVFDKEILEAMAGDDRVRRRIYDSMDERHVGWLEGVLRPWFEPQFTNDYFRRLSETVLALAGQGDCVIVGRGADLLLPKERGFRVRLVAPLEERVDCYANRHEVDKKEAVEAIVRIETSRAEFLHDHFGAQENDPLRYDLTINVERFDLDRTADLILEARRLKAVKNPVRNLTGAL